MHDVIVVGSGPAGSYLSYSLSKKGYNVLNLEEHKEIGKPVECTGLVSKRVFDYIKSNSRINSVHGANIYFPNGKYIHVRKTEETIVMYRDDFDKDASAMAISAGADVSINSRVMDVSINNEYAEVKYKKNGEIMYAKAQIVAGADGANSTVRKILYRKRPEKIISTYQVDSAARLEDQDDVNVYIGSHNSRGFFGWAVPSGDITRIGVGVDRVNAIKYFKNINKTYGDNKIIGINAGPIPIRYLKKTYGNRSVLVGDAAGIVKPLSGGGIYTGIVSAKNAAEAIDRSFQHEDFSEKSLSLYEKLWKKEIGRELKMDARIQDYYSRLSINDRLLNKIYNAINNENIINKINSLGDIDYPSRVVISVIFKRPQLLKYLIFRK
ncbi:MULTISPECIES: NAD(P)/FAD-dependent oxidoreductase [Acidiplasma]|uniref:Geranylgeranyl reductase n=1 Tax=Acidiplasma aeolicum TaxID=507754 RepID=A0A0Q0RKY1_9ARCH|nr:MULTISPECIES: NAD(P)/FAD-dependent oxidoreductase [Acidiplasma]KJE48880.1 geranylgeranyl reductase [Acidiplasma sp. MBA-1]KQB36160.1 geranylgeranyl reductase [Acidiplasma aeolicum]WMT54281.1 MAG: NAD(P)/FAD-dependent oxidoreductase [Acidiplasma sp.]